MDFSITGRVWKFGDNISGDNGIIEFSVIRDFSQPFDESGLGKMCFAKIDPEFPDKVGKGDIVVGGSNFAHHSHPQVAVAIKAAGIAAVIVESTETGFLRKAINYGLPLLLCPGITGIVEAGEELSVDLASRNISVITFHPGAVAVPAAPDAPVAVEDSVASMRALIQRLGPHETGQFHRFDGITLAW